jgi:hypothetical protein
VAGIDLSRNKNSKSHLMAIPPCCWKITLARYNISLPHVTIDVVNMFNSSAKAKTTVARIKIGMPLEHAINVLHST